MFKHFDRSEFDCPCCGFNEMPDEFIKQLDNAREISGIPYQINSGCRCKTHNLAIGGSETSSHLICLAADISAPTSKTRFAVLHGLLEAGFLRIGIYSWGVHVDADSSKPFPVIWI